MKWWIDNQDWLPEITYPSFKYSYIPCLGYFKRIEIHRTEMNGDVMRMVPQEELEIPARGTMSLQPGKYHLMLIGPESVPKEGEKVNLILQFDNGETLHINLPVRKATSGSMMRGPY